MGNLVDWGVSILSQAERRVEIAAQNLSNATTPAYKRRVAFSSLVESANSEITSFPTVAGAVDPRGGKLVKTSSPYDLALTGHGFFAVRYDDRMTYSRQGQFSADAEGRLVNSRGGILQLTTGSDAVVTSDKFEVSVDGTLLEEGLVLGKIAVFRTESDIATDPTVWGVNGQGAAMELLDDASVVQGSYEASNVTTGDEMVLMMEALRRAEAGQRVINVYDDLMGRAVTSFGDAVR